MFYNNDKRKILFRCKNNYYCWCIDDNRNINIINFRIMKEQVIVISQEEQDYVCKHLGYDELLNEEYHNYTGTCRFITLDICSYDRHPYQGYKIINFDEFKSRYEPCQVIKLDKTKAYDLSKLNDIQIQKLAEFVFYNKHESQKWTSFENVVVWFNQYKSSHVFGYMECIVDNFQGFCFISALKNTIDLTDAQILFNNEVWQPKQGDKVLVSYNEIDWHETEFVCYYKDYYYTINGRAKNIKPYKEEIKVGDWVTRKNTYVIFKADDLDVSAQGLIKITDKNTIQLLESILVD